MDRLFIIPPSLPFSGDVVSKAATAAKEAGVKHVLLLSASSAEINPDHKYAPMKGSYYYNQKRYTRLVFEKFTDSDTKSQRRILIAFHEKK